MSRNDGILTKPDPKDVKEYNGLVTKALQSKRLIETNFIELAKSMYEINRKQLYKLKYKSFKEFCDEVLGFSKTTVYAYIAILKLITNYPDYFSNDRAIEFGQKKMNFITEGVKAIEEKELTKTIKEQKKIEIFVHVDPKMASTEIEAYIEDFTNSI